MDEASLWSNYKTTLEELMRLKKANDKILCKPVVKMLEDGLVVGFLTETNQFIKFNNPGAIEEDDGLPQQNLSNSKQNPYEIEMAIDNSTSEDPERIRIVRNINLESSFFALYRATIKSRPGTSHSCGLFAIWWRPSKGSANPVGNRHDEAENFDKLHRFSGR